MGQRLTRRRGSIERLPSGRFRVIIRAGKDPITGRYLKLAETHATEEAARHALERLVAQVDADQVPDRAATFDSLLDRWLEAVDHELNTRATTEVYLRRVLRPALGTMALRKLQHRVDLLDRLYSHLKRCSGVCDGRPFVEHRTDESHDCAAANCQPHRCRPLAPSSIRRVHSIVASALGYAVAWGWIERNPADYAHPPKLARRRAAPPEAEQVARLLNLAFEVDLEMAMFLWLATTTGARRGELVATKWSAVNLDRAHLDIAHNYVVRSGERRLKGTKTDTERRLSLDDLTVQMLTDFRRQRAEVLAPVRLVLAPDAFLFSPEPMCARPWHPDHFTHLYRDLAQTVGIEQPLKNLRHFNATQLLAAGVDLRTTAGRLGHGDGGATTLRVYASWTKPADQSAADNLARDLMRLRSTAAGGAAGKASDNSLAKMAKPVTEVLQPRDVLTYLDIGVALREAITEGRLTSGDLVPTVTQLAAFFDVARSTAQRAVAAVGSAGLICRTGSRWRVT